MNSTLEQRTEQAHELTTLATEITEHYENAIAEAGRAIRSGQEAVKAALLCGQALIKSKALLKHGEWLPWLKRLDSIDDSTAGKYMRLANQCHEINFDNCTSVRQAYVLAGILPEPEHKEGTTEAFTLTPAWALARLSRFTPRINRDVMMRWEPEQRQAVRAQLEPLVRLYEELGTSPSPLIVEATEAEVSSSES